MKKKIWLIAGIALAGLLVLGSIEVSFAQDKPFGKRVLIGFKDGIGHQAAERRKGWVRNFGGDVHYSFRLLPLVSAKLPENLIAKLKDRAEIAYVEDDIMMHAIQQETSWGVDRIDADLVWSTNTGAGVDVAILDTGIDYDHPDLVDNIAGGINYAWWWGDGSTNKRYWNDRNGHGSHCAGIIAAENNSIGVVGVAPGANLWAVKVLGDNGSGYVSDIIQGLEWCVDNQIEVASMSFGGGYSESLKNACNTTYAAGVLLVAAAGNEYGGAVIYPAAHDSVMAVSATDAGDAIADFSSIGPEVELAAPGVSIKSTYRGGGYAFGSGTSMACPHVAGVAALIWTGANADVRARLQQTAEDLGAGGWDPEYGYGLVDAAAAAGVAGEPPVADFMAAPANGEAPLTANFTDLSTGTITNWLWDFGDTGSSTQRDPSHEYQSAGSYTVSLTVTGPGGPDTETKENYITVTAPPPPVAGFSGSPTSGDAPLAVQFTDESTGSITNWSWNFGDGESSTEQNPSHTYENAGLYTVSLTVTGPGGSDEEIKGDYITVTTPAAPVAAFSGSPTSGEAPLAVQFTDKSTGSITSWSWTFGDGGSSTEQNPSHTYLDAGVYTVSLTVEGPGGPDTETKTDYIEATTPAPPVANFMGDPIGGYAPLTVNFTDLSTETITGWSWDFDDGGSSTQQDPTHEYQSAGSYTVSLTVTGPGGSDTETKPDYIYVEAPSAPTAYVSIEMSKQSFWRWSRVTATVTIRNDEGAPIEGATVEGHWSGAYNRNVSGTTRNGQVSFGTVWTRTEGTFTFTVDSVVKNSQEYILAGETSDSINGGSSGTGPWRE